jgi:flagellar hook assembly protein FlgD
LAKGSNVLSATEALPESFELKQNYPNPFNPSTTISFALPEAGRVTLRIYSLTGQLVRELVQGEMASGRHSVSWNGHNDLGAQVASGLYFYRLEVRPRNEKAAFTQTRRMMLVK